MEIDEIDPSLTKPSEVMPRYLKQFKHVGGVAFKRAPYSCTFLGDQGTVQHS